MEVHLSIWAILRVVPSLLSEKDGICAKGWYASKTVWFNLLFLALFLIGRDSLGLHIQLSNEQLEILSVLAACIGNLVLRFVSKRPVSLKPAGTVCNDKTSKEVDDA